MLPSKFGQSQGTPCEVTRFFLSTLQTSGECQWHYANPLLPSSQSTSKSPPDQPPSSTARHHLLQGYEGVYYMNTSETLLDVGKILLSKSFSRY